KIDVSPIALRPCRRRRQRARQAPLVKRHARDDRDVVCVAVRKEGVFRRLIEDVVDDLHAVHDPGLEGVQHVRRLPSVHADAECSYQALFLELLGRPLPSFIVRPCVIPDVELLEIDRLGAEILETLLRELADMVWWKHVGDWGLRLPGPREILWWDLRRDD